MAARTIILDGAIAVTGLKETASGLRKVRKDLPRAISKVSRETAKDPVLKRARSKWRAQGITPTKATQALSATGTATGAAIILKASKVPTAMGIEFGAHIHKVYGRAVPQASMKKRVFKPWRGNKFNVNPGASTGYIVQDAIRETLPIVERRWLNEVTEAIDKAVRDG